VGDLSGDDCELLVSSPYTVDSELERLRDQGPKEAPVRRVENKPGELIVEEASGQDAELRQQRESPHHLETFLGDVIEAALAEVGTIMILFICTRGGLILAARTVPAIHGHVDYWQFRLTTQQLLVYDVVVF